MHVIVCGLRAEVNVQDLLIVLGENFADNIAILILWISHPFAEQSLNQICNYSSIWQLLQFGSCERLQIRMERCKPLYVRKAIGRWCRYESGSCRRRRRRWSHRGNGGAWVHWRHLLRALLRVLDARQCRQQHFGRLRLLRE